ncbi:MAG: roadblock/LC7 domain-containing protein [Oscillochloris sp.]|nr:roadblock/LC7 domain-containing protein [Oscillochloris sp.]
MAQSQLVLSVQQLTEIRNTLAQLGQQADVRCALLADMSGQDIVSWEPRGGTDTASIAALAAGDLMATLEVGRMLGGRRACNLIVQEHDDLTILIGRVGEGLLLLLAMAKDVPLGWSRLALKRTSDRILSVVGSAAMTPPPPAVSEDFEQNFAAQLDSIW